MLMVVAVIAAMFSQTEAFSASKISTSNRISSFKPLIINNNKVASVSNTKLSALPALAAMAPAAKLFLGLPIMYMLFSANEYVTHRYYQHNEIGKMFFYKTLRKFGLFPKIDGGGHVEHHAETYDSMNLKTDDAKWMASPPAQRLHVDPWRGTAFTWPSTALMFVQCVPTVFPVFIGLLGWSLPATSVFYFMSMALHGLVWNAIHPAMHGLPHVPWSIGYSSKTLSFLNGSPLFEALRLNHIGHHVASGRSNYNVCCPGMDHVVGTFMKQADWEPKVRKNSRETRAIEGALTSEQM